MNAEATAPTTTEQRRQELGIGAAYRAWARNRGALDRLRKLQAAITDAPDESLAGQH